MCCHSSCHSIRPVQRALNNAGFAKFVKNSLLCERLQMYSMCRFWLQMPPHRGKQHKAKFLTYMHIKSVEMHGSVSMDACLNYILFAVIDDILKCHCLSFLSHKTLKPLHLSILLICVSVCQCCGGCGAYIMG